MTKILITGLVAIHLTASLWHGSAKSWIDLNPPNASESYAFTASNKIQAGWCTVAGRHHAGVWQGSADSWTDLNRYVPSSFTGSQATGVWSDILRSPTCQHYVS